MRLKVGWLKPTSGAEEVHPRTVPLGAANPCSIQQPGGAAAKPLLMLVQPPMSRCRWGQEAHPAGAAELQVTALQQVQVSCLRSNAADGVQDSLRAGELIQQAAAATAHYLAAASAPLARHMHKRSQILTHVVPCRTSLLQRLQAGLNTGRRLVSHQTRSRCDESLALSLG